jgi:hypothetical protein
MSRAQKGVGPFLPTEVAPIFGPRGVAKLVRRTAGLWGDGDPHPIKPALGSLRSSENWQQRGIREFFNSLLSGERKSAPQDLCVVFCGLNSGIAN